MATAGQILLTKLVALVVAILTALWWRNEGFGWLTTITAGIIGYIFWKIVIALVIGRYQGGIIRAQIDGATDLIRRMGEKEDRRRDS